MATELGQAYVQIMPSAKGIQGSISKQLNPEATSAGTSAGSLIASTMGTALMAGAAVAAAAVGKLVKSSIVEGAALQQSLGGVDTLFKENAGMVKKYADEAYKSAGLSANAYMENVTGFSASLLQSLGGNTKKAAEISNMAMIDMADNSNKMGTSMESIQYAYQGFAKQNYTMLDNLKLGYGGTKEEMQRLLTDAEKLTGKKYDMSNLADVYSAIHEVQKEIGITGTTAREAEHTFSGSLAAMKSSASNLLGKLALGEDIRPSLEQLGQTAYTFFVGNFIPMVGNIFKGLGSIVQMAFTELGPMFTSGMDTQMPNIITKGGELIGNFVVGILEALPSLIEGLGNIIITFQNYVYQNYPVILQAGADLLLKLVDGIIANLPSVIQSAIEVISKFTQMIANNMPAILQKGLEIIGQLVAGIIQRLPDIIAMAIKIIVVIVQGIANHLPKMAQSGVKIITALVNGLISMIGQVIGAIGKIGAQIIKGVSGINLFSHGSSIISGFLDGLKAKYEEVKSFVGGIASWISEHKGPISYDRKLLIPHGNAIMDSLHQGLSESFKDVKSTVSGMADELQSAFGVPQLAADMPLNVQSQIASQLASGQLAYQMANTSSEFQNNFDLLKAISDLAGRPINVSMQINEREIAKAIAQPVEERQSLLKEQMNRMRGIVN